MSYTYDYKAANFLGLGLCTAEYTCGVSGKKIFTGDLVLDMNPEVLQRYGQFLSEQPKICGLVGTPLISNIMS